MVVNKSFTFWTTKLNEKRNVILSRFVDCLLRNTVFINISQNSLVFIRHLIYLCRLHSAIVISHQNKSCWACWTPRLMKWRESSIPTFCISGILICIQAAVAAAKATTAAATAGCCGVNSMTRFTCLLKKGTRNLSVSLHQGSYIMLSSTKQTEVLARAKCRAASFCANYVF